MKKLVTDNPTDNGMMMLNLVFVKDHEVWVRYGSREGTDCTLVEFCRRLCVVYGSCNYAEVPFKVGDELDDIGDILMDCSGDGCPVGTMYFAMIQAAELRERFGGKQWGGGGGMSVERLTGEQQRIISALRDECSDCSCFGDKYMCSLGPCENLNAANLIEQLAAELAQVRRERNAAVRDIEAVVTHYSCYVCKHSQSGYGYGCDIATDLQDKRWNCKENKRFEWRGPCAENGEEDENCV